MNSHVYIQIIDRPRDQLILYVCMAICLAFCNGPQTPEMKQYIFYLHGKIVEDQGANAYSEQFGNYDYEGILNALQEENTIVISEVRPKNTDIREYADKIVSEIEQLLTNGTPPHNITIVGGSKGALITMQISTLLKNKNVNFVLIAGNIQGIDNFYDFDLHGNILGFYDLSDQIAGRSYQNIIEKSTGINRFKEIELKTDLGHGVVFKPLKEWISPAKEWMQASVKK